MQNTTLTNNKKQIRKKHLQVQEQELCATTG